MKTQQILCFAAIALAAVSCDKKKTAETMGTPAIDVAQAVVDTVLLSKTYPGTLTAVNSVDIVGRVNGYLLTQTFTNGDHVSKGQVLYKIEDTQYVDAVNQAKAQLETAESQYAYASKNYDAMQRALKSDAVSQIEVLNAKSAMEQSQAAIESSKAALQTAQTNLSYCTVRAPFSGNMAISEFSPGAYIGGAAAPVKLGTLYDNSTLNANFFIEDASYLRMFTNDNNRSMIDFDRVPIYFSEPLPHDYYGRLYYISPDVNTGTGTLHLRAMLDNEWNELREGMYVTIKLPYKLDTHAVMVKDAAISSSQTNKFLYVVNDSNRIVYTPVEVGDMANDSMRIITKGLNGDEKYVTKALLKVRPGMEIKPILTK